MDSLPERKTLRLPHGLIGYREAGDGSAVVFLHGLGGNAASWLEQYQGLAEGFRVIGWDAPGYGASDPHPDPSADTYADALVNLLDELALEQVCLVGHSMGGVIAPRVVHRHPGRVSRLVLSATRASFAGEAARGFAKRLDELETLGAHEFGQRRAASMVAPEAAPEVLEAVSSIAAEVRPEGYRDGVALLGATDNRALLPCLAVPTLAIAGEADGIAPPKFLEEIASLVPGARLERIPGVAHAAYLEASPVYNAVLRRFFR